MGKPGWAHGMWVWIPRLPCFCASVSLRAVAQPMVSTIPFLFPSCHGKAEECIGLCRALMSALNWLLRCAGFYAEKVKETLEQAAAESQLKMCLERLEKMLSSTKNRALIHIAKLEETCAWLPLPCPALPHGALCPWLLSGLPPCCCWPWGDVIATSPFPLPAPAALSLQL